MRARRFLPRVAFPLAIAVLFAAPTGAISIAPFPTATPAPIAHGHAVSAPVASSATATGLGHPPPPVTVCPNPPPTWGPVNGVFPVSFSESLQMPCVMSADQAHLSLSSNVANSGQRWMLPVTLANGTANGSPDLTFFQEGVGLVAAGDIHSAWRQSYVQVVFLPTGSGTSTMYSVSTHIWALEDQNVSKAASGLQLTWNDTWYWEADYANSTMTGGFSAFAGDTIDVTFAGVAGSGKPMDVWINDTTHTHKEAWSLNYTKLGGPYNFTPYYNASCLDTCVLNWAYGLGSGIEFSNCPVDAVAADPCSSYNQGFWANIQQPSFGQPHYWQGGAYTGDYYYVAPESNSGVCNALATFGTVATCYNFATYNGQGYYPYFTFNATGLDFGTNTNWTLENLGGYSFEYRASAAAQDIAPLFFYQDHNDSRAGFASPNTAISLNATVLDLGSVRYVNATYSLNNGTSTTISLTRVSGSLTFGDWTGTIPSGANGWITYNFTATNNASLKVSDPTYDAHNLWGSYYHVARGPLPTFTVQVQTEDPTCAQVVINGTAHANGTVISSLPGFYSLFAKGCYPWVFNGWAHQPGGVQPSGTGLSTQVEISASGTVNATWLYVRPMDTVTLVSWPNCGEVDVAGTPYANDTTISLPDSGNYSIGTVGCAGESFRGWTFVGPWKILGNSLTIFGNGTLAANYVSSSTASALVFETNPSTCGGVAFFGAGYTSGESVSVGPGGYPIAPDPCSHWGFRNFTISGKGTIPSNNSWVTLTGGATITENNYVLTEVNFVIGPPSCGPALWDGTNVTNGEVLVVANNSTHTVVARVCPGHYLIGLSGGASGGVTVVAGIATVTASGTVYIEYGTGNSSQFLGFITDPSACGGVNLNGVEYADSQYTYEPPYTTWTLTPVPCAGYGFQHWVTFGNVAVVGSTLFFNQSGAVEAVFRPLTGLLLFTSPASCGSIKLGANDYAGNNTVSVTENVQYTVQAIPCAGDAFVQWVNSTGALLGNGMFSATNTVSLVAESILTADFAPVRYTVTVSVNPASCGAVRLASSTLINGSTISVPLGVYPVSPDPCTGDHLVRWWTNGSLAVAGPSLYVNGSGTVGAIYQPVPPSVTLSLANSSYAGDAVVIAATVAVPVPPYNYSYTWTFNDGSATVTTPVNFTSHTFADAGRWHVTVVVLDPFNRTANASGYIQIVQSSPYSFSLLTPLALAALGLVAVVVILAVVVAFTGRRPRAPSEEEEAPAPVRPDETLEPLPTSPETGSPTGEEPKA